MKLTRLEQVYASLLLIVLGAIVIHAPLSVGLGSICPHYGLLIKSWKEIVLTVASMIAVFLITKRHLWQVLLKDTLVRLIAVYSLLHILLAAFDGLSQVTLAGLLIDLRYVGYFLLIYILMLIAPIYRIRFIVVAFIGALIVVGFGVLQLFLPHDVLKYIGYSRLTISPYLTVDQNPDYIRINSTLRGPNPLGAYTVIAIAGITSFAAKLGSRINTPERRYGLIALFTASLIVLWVSYSRSALIAAVIMLVIITGIVYGKKLPAKNIVTISGVVVVLTIGLIALGGTNFVNNVILHDNPRTGSSLTSNQGHLSSLQHGLSNALAQPFGAGIGSTGSASLYGTTGMIIVSQYIYDYHRPFMVVEK
jgi:hypothetical protein